MSEPVVGPFVPKHVRIFAELVRTACSLVSALGVVAVLLHVYGIA